MLEKLRFYIQHSINDLRVNGQRTLFALLCIAAGVAAIVSLMTLGVMIDDALTGSVQETNHGDIRLAATEGGVSDEALQRGQDENVIAEEGQFAVRYFPASGIGKIQAWFASNYPNQAEITYRQVFTSLTDGISVSIPGKGDKAFVTPYMVETDVYPFYGTVQDEEGRSLDEMINAPTDVVISQNLADDLDADVGDTFKVSGATQDFTIAGIVPTDSESGFENLLGALLGYYYLDTSALDLFSGMDKAADVIYVKLDDPSMTTEVSDAFERRFPYVSSRTTEDLKDQNSEISDAVGQLITVMGLVSLLIGGIGIVNTMQVIVSRRTTEIAVLKTIGLEGEQITVLFLVEALLMGIAGSLIGIVIGWIAVFGIKGVAEAFTAQQLDFHITLQPPLTGFVVGILVTAIFGFLPTLSAGTVRPNLVLRPTDSVMPSSGRLRSFVAIVFVMLALSVVAQPLVGDLLSTGTVGEQYDQAVEQLDEEPTTELPESIRDIELMRLMTAGLGAFLGLLMAVPMLIGGIWSGWAQRNILFRLVRWPLLLFGLPLLTALFGFAFPALLLMFSTFISVAILYVVLWVLIWLVGHFFPTWRFVDLKIALRSMLATKGRAASTLLALVVGVFTLSLITMLADAITNRFEELLVEQTGGNVIVLAAGGVDTLDQIETRLDSIEGVNSYAALQNYQLHLRTVRDVSAGETLEYQTLKDRAVDEVGTEMADMLDFYLGSVDARSLDSNLPEVEFYAGRQLRPGDGGPYNPEEGDYPPLVIGGNEAVLATGIEVGDLLTFETVGASSNPLAMGQTPRELTFEVVGIIDNRGGQISTEASSPNYAPLAAFEGIRPNTVSAVVDVAEASVPDVRRSLNEVPGVFVLETRLLNDLVNRVIDRFTSFPILVAALALFTGGVVIANSVALTTLERRREIGIMKAVGLQRERVLGMLLMEYGLMGFIGGLIGVGIGGAILLALLSMAFGGELGNSIPYLTALGLMALCIIIALVAAIMTAWPASGEKPLNVLRYE